MAVSLITMLIGGAIASALSKAVIDIGSSAAKQSIQHAFGKDMQHDAQGFSALENQRNRDFTKEMTSTSYQRSVDDMKKAGLNPALAMPQNIAAQQVHSSGLSQPHTFSGPNPAGTGYNANKDKTFTKNAVQSMLFRYLKGH